MNVQRVCTEHGSRIEPPLDQKWTDLKKLHWKLAVVLYDNGLPPDAVRVEQADYRINGRRIWNAYSILSAGSTFGPSGYSHTWSVMNGIGIGLRIPREENE